MMNIRIWLYTLLSTWLLSSAVHADTPELGKYPKRFVADNYIVTMLRLGPAEDKTVLIQVSGIDNEFDNRIFKHKMICDTSDCLNYKYETNEIPGKERWWTVQQETSWNYATQYFFPYGINQKYSLYETHRPNDFDAKAFYQTYIGQKK